MEERDTQLSQAYREASHPEPSSALDARILDAARQAVAKPAVKPAVRRRPTWFTWAVPFSTAAVVVLGVTLLFEMQKQAPEMLESPTAMPPSVSLEQAETATTPESRPDETGERQGRNEAAKPTSPAAVPARTQVKAPAKQSIPEPVAAETDAAAMEAPLPPPFPAQSDLIPAPPPPPATKAAPMPVPEAARSPGVAGNLADQSAEAMSMRPPPPAMESTNARASMSGGAQVRKAENTIEAPERMIETIRKLILQGHLDEARQALEKLRRAYPSFELPTDLKELQ